VVVTQKDIDITEVLENPNLISTDSRELEGKKYFICFVGEKYDSHDFVSDLVSNPELKYIFVEKDLDIESEKLVRVESSLGFYHHLAHQYRLMVNPKLIAVTGSAGKTTTKNLLHLVFAQKFKTHATEKNFNNEYGVPKTILSMPKDTEVLICEMGMRGLGQIDVLTKIAEPNYVAITNIGSAHIEILGSKANIRRAKLEIINGLNPRNTGNTLYINSKVAEFIEKKAEYKSLIKEKNCEIKVFSSYKYESIPKFLISEGLLEDMELVNLIAQDCGIEQAIIDEALQAYVPDSGRGNFLFVDDINGKKNILFIDETYNSNLEAVRNSVTALKQVFPNDKKIVVLGAIKESDLMEVEKLFLLYNKDPAIELVDARHFEHEEAKMIIESLVEDNSVVFFKASRSEKLEELIALFAS
jgi:UDP-N-acetylmuramoyl-tripeptide--D-alanyl-D-alanine ligase